MQASLLATTVLGVILWLTLGTFQPLLVVVLVVTLVVLAFESVTGRTSSIGRGIDVEGALGGALVVGALLLALEPQLIYAEVPDPYYGLRILLAGVAASVIVLAFVVMVRGAPPSDSTTEHSARTVETALVLIGGLFLVARVLVPFASPEPVIDVFVNNTLGVDYLLDGNNPYRMTYPDIYHGAYDFVPALGYPPGSLLLLTPFRWLGDVRLAGVFADLCTSALWFYWMRRVGFAVRPAVMMALVWLSFPASLFVFEQAWLDPLLVPFWLGLVWAMCERKWIVAGLLLGVMISVKQYAVFFAVATAVFAYRVGGARALVQGLAATAGLLVVLVVPFAIGDPQAFFDQVAGTFIERGFRRDSLSLVALVANVLDRDLPGLVLFGATLGGIVGWAWWLWRRETPDEVDWISAVAFTFAIAVLVGKQAGCNYYYLLAALLLSRSIVASRSTLRVDTLRA